MTICIVCGSDDPPHKLIYGGLKQCERCGHYSADIDVSMINFQKIYDDRYFSGDEYLDYLSDKPVFERQFNRRIRLLRDIKQSGNLIEVGCAYGFFLAVAKEFYNATGFDISPGPISYAIKNLGVNAHCNDFLEVDIPNEGTDIVVMWDTIEHLPRPDLYVEKINSILKPEGILCLTTGDIGSVLARVRKEKWRLIHPPTHLHYFNKATVTWLLERFGFRVIDCRYIGVSRSWRQIAYSIFVLGKKHPSPFYDFLSKSFMGDFTITINTFDIMQVVAEKT